MNLLELTHPELVFINPPCRTPEALIRWLSEPLVGETSSPIKTPLSRASYTAKVKVPPRWAKRWPFRTVNQTRCSRRRFAALFDEPVIWPGLEGDEAVRMVFLLAIPHAEAGSTHMQLLTTLTSSLAEERARNALLAARTGEEALSALRREMPQNADAEPGRSLVIPLILGVLRRQPFSRPD